MKIGVMWRSTAKWTIGWWVLMTNLLAIIHPASTVARASADWPIATAVGWMGVALASIALADVIWTDLIGRQIWPGLDRTVSRMWGGGRRVVTLGFIDQPVVVSPRHALCVAIWMAMTLVILLRLLMAADPAIDRSWVVVVLYSGLAIALLSATFLVAIEGPSK